MKRLALFELEDQAWFPAILRDCMTDYLMALHQMIGTPEKLAQIIQELLTETNCSQIQDCCSGSGGPLLAAHSHLKNITLHLSDLYPNKRKIQQLQNNEQVFYEPESVDVLEQNILQGTLQTLICSFHHLSPAKAKAILEQAMKNQSAICIFELTDNAMQNGCGGWLLFQPF